MIITQSKLLKKYSNLTYYFTDISNNNLAFHVNDNINDVKQNHKNLASLLNYNQDLLVHMKQIHSDIIHIVDVNDNFNNPPTCDALITNKLNIALMVMVADCSPVLFYDDIKKVIAVAHVGRSGAFKNIVSNVINSFTSTFNSNPQDIVVVIGANIKKCCYEVGAEINEDVKALKLDYSIVKKNSSYYLDIDSIILSQLKDKNIKNENIEFIDICTKCNYKKYFSYRHNSKCGRFSGVLKLNS
jgi:YfiH family protein